MEGILDMPIARDSFNNRDLVRDLDDHNVDVIFRKPSALTYLKIRLNDELKNQKLARNVYGEMRARNNIAVKKSRTKRKAKIDTRIHQPLPDIKPFLLRLNPRNQTGDSTTHVPPNGAVGASRSTYIIQLREDATVALELNNWVRVQLLQLYTKTSIVLPDDSALLKQSPAAEYLREMLKK